jgi:hypothetical protein
MPTQTELKIQGIVKTDCDTLQSLIGDLTQAEVNRKGLRELYETKKCSFIDTEYNYRLYRNLELNTGAELIQATTEIKQNVASYIKLSDSLAAALRTVTANVKDAKKKFGDLRKASLDLDMCISDKCNCTQMIILTGKPNTPGVCPNADDTIEKLLTRPLYFSEDCDTLLTSSADVSGIQTFVNVKSIDQLQTDFSTAAKAFDTQVQTKMTQGLAELTQLQKDLTKSITDLTTADHALYNKRDEVDAETDTIEFFCEGKCECKIKDKDANGHEIVEGRFEDCKRTICDICHKMDDHYCQRAQNDPAMSY